jgi:predicted amidohydrolase YtcJ
MSDTADLVDTQDIALLDAGLPIAAPGRLDRGRLRPRMLGDLAVLSQNPLDVPTDRLPDITVDASIVGGKVAYRR